MIPLTHRRLFSLFLPLAFSGILYPLSRPIINAALARSLDPVTAIAAFAVAYSISMPLQSPMFGLRQVVTALGVDREMLGLVARLNWIIAVGASIAILVIAVPPVYNTVVVGVMGIPPRIARVGPMVLVVIAVGPTLTAARGYYQGVLVRHGITIPVGIGALGFLLVSSGLLWAGVLWTDWEGAFLAATALAFGQLAYVACVWQPARVILKDRIPDFDPSIRPEQRSRRYVFRFYLPLAVSTALMTLVEPMIQSAMAHSPLAEASLAAYSVTISFIWLAGAPLWNLQQVVISQVTGRQSLEIVRKFSLIVSAGLTLMLAVLALPPVAEWLFGSVIGVTGEVKTLAVDGFKWLVPAGLFMGARSLYHGILTCRGSTGGIQTGSFLRTITLVIILILGVSWGHLNGFLIAAAAQVVSAVVEVIYLRHHTRSLVWEDDPIQTG
jgi:hypothetical protein